MGSVRVGIIVCWMYSTAWLPLGSNAPHVPLWGPLVAGASPQEYDMISRTLGLSIHMMLRDALGLGFKYTNDTDFWISVNHTYSKLCAS